MSMLPADAHRVLAKDPPLLPSVWFMFDCHAFARIDTRDHRAAHAQITELFGEDGCGMVSTKDSRSKTISLHGHVLPGGTRYGVTAYEVDAFLRDYYALAQESEHQSQKM